MIASLAAPATFSDWFADPLQLRWRMHARWTSSARRSRDRSSRLGHVHMADLDPIAAAQRLGGRPVLVLHGSDDDVVPVSDARMIAEAGRESAELRILAGAGHRLNSDPRAMALLLGWLERQRS